MSLEWPARSFVWLMPFYRLACSFVCLERLSLIGSARRDVSAEGRAAMLSWCMVGASGGQRHDVKEVEDDFGVQYGRLDFVSSICHGCAVPMSQRLHEQAFLIITTESKWAFILQWRGVTLS